MSDDRDLGEWQMDLDVKLAFQERLIRELDALVRAFGDRLEKAERELAQLKQSIVADGEDAKPGEPPPHY